MSVQAGASPLRPERYECGNPVLRGPGVSRPAAATSSLTLASGHPAAIARERRR